SLTLDARDKIGVESVIAEISVKKGNQDPYFMNLNLERISGESKYGTWEGTWEINRSDTTYSVTKITLSNGEEVKEYNIANRSVYATSSVPESIPQGTNFLTGFSILGDNLR